MTRLFSFGSIFHNLINLPYAICKCLITKLFSRNHSGTMINLFSAFMPF